MREHSNDEMDMQMDMQEYRSALAKYMRHSPEDVTQECHASDECDGSKNDNEEEEHDQQMMDVGEQMMQANVGRRGQGVKELSEIEIERHNALIEDVLPDERYATLEDSHSMMTASEHQTKRPMERSRTKRSKRTVTAALTRNGKKGPSHPARRSRAMPTMISTTQTKNSRWLQRCL